LEFHLRQADRYAGSPMLSSMLGVYAAMLGDCSRSLGLFERGYPNFIPDPWWKRAVTLPRGWDAVEVNRTWARDQPTSLHAKHGAHRAELTPARQLNRQTLTGPAGDIVAIPPNEHRRRAPSRNQ
jgi:hypothetical protein